MVALEHQRRDLPPGLSRQGASRLCSSIHVHQLGPCLMRYHTMMQAWRQQGHMLLGTPTGLTHHAAFPSTGSAGAPHSPCLPHRSGLGCMLCDPRMPHLQGMLWLLWMSRMLSRPRVPGMPPPLQRLWSVALIEARHFYADKLAPAQPLRTTLQALHSSARQTHWQLVSPHSIALQQAGSRPWAHHGFRHKQQCHAVHWQPASPDCSHTMAAGF